MPAASSNNLVESIYNPRLTDLPRINKTQAWVNSINNNTHLQPNGNNNPQPKSYTTAVKKRQPWSDGLYNPTPKNVTPIRTQQTGGINSDGIYTSSRRPPTIMTPLRSSQPISNVQPLGYKNSSRTQQVLPSNTRRTSISRTSQVLASDPRRTNAPKYNRGRTYRTGGGGIGRDYILPKIEKF